MERNRLKDFAKPTKRVMHNSVLSASHVTYKCRFRSDTKTDKKKKEKKREKITNRTRMRAGKGTKRQGVEGRSAVGSRRDPELGCTRRPHCEYAARKGTRMLSSVSDVILTLLSRFVGSDRRIIPGTSIARSRFSRRDAITPRE